MKTEMHLLSRIFRVLPAGICLCLMAWVSVTPTMAAGVSCDDWNTPMFFLGADTTDISRCLKAGADPNSRNILNGETPLYAAAAFSKTPVVVKALLDAGANPNARNVHGVTPLHAAAVLSKNPSVVAVLVKAGAKVNARDEFGKTPLHMAALDNKTPAVVKALMDAGANPTMRDKSGKTPWDYVKNNAALKGTEVYWLLNEARFK